jgi:hypothetical protein
MTGPVRMPKAKEEPKEACTRAISWGYEYITLKVRILKIVLVTNREKATSGYVLPLVDNTSPKGRHGTTKNEQDHIWSRR